MKKTFNYLFSKAFCEASEFIGGHTLYRLNGAKNVEFKNKIEYCGDKKLYFNTCRPTDRQNGDKLPVFVYIHGGGFVSGAPDFRRAIMGNIAAEGYFVVGVFYGKAPQYIFPKPVENIYKALAFLKDKAGEWNIDTDKIFLGGESAGATLSVTLGAISVNEAYKSFFDLDETVKDLRFSGIVSICGLYDMADAIGSGYPYIEEYICAYADKDANTILTAPYYRRMSPIKFLAEGFPPIFVITGEKDAFSPGAAKFIERLNELGVENGGFHGTGKTSVHAYTVGQFFKISRESLRAALDFIAKYRYVIERAI
jgi:acetyl esterase/lipase